MILAMFDMLHKNKTFANVCLVNEPDSVTLCTPGPLGVADFGELANALFISNHLRS